MKTIRKRLMALLLSLVMVCSLLVNVSLTPRAADAKPLPNSSVKVVTLVNDVETDITSTTVLNNGDKVRVLLSWSISNLSTDPISADTDLWYDLNATGVAISNKSGSVIQNNVAVGTYNIDENGRLHIFITDSTLLGQSDISGGLDIDAVINVNDLTEDEKGQVKASIAGTTFTVQKSDPASLPSVSKSRTGDVYSQNGKNYQDFKVIVTENGNANSITFTDEFGAYLTYVDGSMTLDGTSVTPTGSGSEISYTIQNPVKGQQYEFIYTAEISNEAFANDYYYGSSDSSYFNTAKVNNSNDKTASSNTFALGEKSWISKWGGYDYNNKDLYWGITVNGGDAIDISGTTVTDVLPEGVTIKGDVTIKDSSNQVVATIKPGSDFIANGYTFPEGSVGQYTIEYKTDITDSTNGMADISYLNTAKLTNTTYNITKETTGTANVYYDWIEKDYLETDKNNNTVTWKTVINIPKTQTEYIDLTLSDDFGDGLTYKANSFTVDYGTTNVVGGITSGTDISVDANGAFSIGLGQVKYEEGKSNQIVITYTTSFDPGDAEQVDYYNKAVVTDVNGNSQSDDATFRYTKSDVKIVQYKQNEGTDGTKSKWYIQVANTGTFLDEVNAGKRVYIYDVPTLTDTNGNPIDAKFTVVPGSVTVGGVATDLITASTDDGKTIKFDLTEYIKANDEYLNYYELRYTLDLDGETIRKLIDTGITTTKLGNEVTGYLYDNGIQEEKLGSVVGNGQATPTIGTLLTKSYNYTATTAPYAEYSIDINPNAYDLIEGDGTLSLEDVMGKSLNLDISSVNLVAADGSAVTGITTGYDSSTGTLTIDNIPDAKHLILTYKVLVNVEYDKDKPTFESQAGNIDVSNACTLYATSETLSSNSVKLTGTIQKSSAWATSDYGSIIISKHSGLTPLEGAKFKLTAYELAADGTLVENPDYATDYSGKGVTIGEIETDTNGRKTVNLLFDILYKIEETQAPSGYRSDGEPLYVVIPGNDFALIETAIADFETANSVTVNQYTSGSYVYVENYEIDTTLGSVTVNKVDQYGDAVAEAWFSLLKKNDDTAIFEPYPVTGSLKTDATGKLVINDLPEGTYILSETNAPTGYDSSNLFDSGEFVIGGTTRHFAFTATNKKLTGTWNITKVDASDSSVFLPGVTFGLYKADKLVDTGVTDANGKLTFGELELNVEYTIKEESTIDGYILNTDTFSTTFTANDTTTDLIEDTTVTNAKQGGTIQIKKTDVDDTTPVAGAVYTLYDENFNIVYKNNAPYTVTTDSTGVATFTELTFGTYYVRETEAPTDYELDPAFYNAVVVDSNDEIETVERTNKKKTLVTPYISFKFKKVGGTDTSLSSGGSQEALPGATYELYRVDDSGNLAELVDTAISDAEGYVYFMNITSQATPGAADYYKFAIREATAPNGYLLDSNIIYIDANVEDVRNQHAHADIITDKTLVNALTGDGATMTNVKLEGSIKLIKEDADTSKAIKGARFAIYKNGSDTASLALYTNDDGVVEFTGLEYGATYVIKEIEAPKGYVLSDETITVKIGETTDGTNYTFAGMATGDMAGTSNVYTYTSTYKNSPLKLSISKQSITNSSEVIGAKLVLKDILGNSIDEWTSGGSTHTIDSSKLNTNTVYTLTETAAPGGYGYTDSVNFIIHEDGVVEILTGDTTAEVSGTTLIMKDQAIDIKLVKVDSVTGEKLSGAELELRDAAGNTLDYWTSTSNDEYIISSYNAGTLGIKVPDVKGEYTEYIFYEKTAPSDYYLADEIHFYLDYYGQVYLKDNTGNYVTVTDNRIVMEDIPYSDDVVISKKAIAGGTELEGATLKVTNKANGAVIDQWISGTTAHTIDISEFTKGQTYLLTEVSAPMGYAYAETIEFTINADGKVEINGQEVTGNMIYMFDNALDISVLKEKEDGTPLSGAQLGVYDEKNNLVCDFSSTQKAYAIGSKLAAGTVDENGTETLAKYRLAEITPPFGYERAEDIYFALDSKGNIYISEDQITYNVFTGDTLVMTDKAKSISISKVDITNSKEIDNAALEITNKTTGEVILQWTSSATDGPKKFETGKFFEADTVYTLTETTAPYGYKIAESISFKFDTDANVWVQGADGSFTKLTDSTIVMKDELSYLYFSKVDITTKNQLPGATLTITDSTGSKLDEWISTSAKHEILVNKFTPDKEYTLTETTAPQGYEVAESIIFKLDTAGNVYVKTEGQFVLVKDGIVVMEDRAVASSDQDKPGTPITDSSTPGTSTNTTDSTAQTGDTAPVDKVFVLMVMSGLGIVVFGRKKKVRAGN